MDNVPVIGVMGGADVPEDVQEEARELGRRIGERGWVLLNGGRDEGVMHASAAGAARAEGVVLGVLPGRSVEDGKVAEGVSHPLFTGMGEARNVINVLSSDVVAACRGGAGTLSEVCLAVKTGTPVVLVDWPDGEVPEQLEGSLVERAGSARTAIDAIEKRLSSKGKIP